MSRSKDNRIRKCQFCKTIRDCTYLYQKWACDLCFPEFLAKAREENKTYARKWRAENVDHVREKRLAYSDKNKEKLRIQKQRWLKINIDRIKLVSQKYREDNSEKVRGMALKSFWPQLSPEERIVEYNRLLSLQNNVCAICHGEEKVFNKRTNKPRFLQVDHCHKTGTVRGLLCHSCNIGLGKFFDKPENCEKAAEYLKNVG